MTATDTYASVLFEVARAESDRTSTPLGQVEEELFRVARSFEANDDLRWVLSDDSLPLEVRQGTLGDLLSGRVSPLSVSLVGWLVGQGQARDMVDILDGVVDRLAALQDRSVAEVRVAEPLDDQRIEALRSGLSRTMGRDVTIKVVVDPSVIGGVVTRVGDTVIDGTIGHRLAQMRRTVGNPG